MLARQRLAQERKDWRKNRPYGFVAKPEVDGDGSINLLLWNCLIPGKERTPWEGGSFPVKLAFSEDYPSRPPRASFPKGFIHPNVYPDGHVCLSILNDDQDLGGGWSPSLTIGQILLGIQELLTEPNLNSAAQQLAYDLLKYQPQKYREEIIKQALKYKAVEEED